MLLTKFQWTDKRLTFDHQSEPVDIQGKQVYNMIWIPDFYLSGALLVVSGRADHLTEVSAKVFPNGVVQLTN